jgi:nucleoside-diphosphate-sugar epimerase
MELLAGLPNLRRLGYMSTTSISGTHKGLFSENDFDTGQKFKNHYESTKFEAERIVREYADRIPTVIFRPTIVVGDSHSGEIEKIDGPYYGFVMISRNLHIAIQKSGHTKCHIAPVDFVTDAIAAIYEKPDAAGKVFHVGDPQPMLYDEFFDLVCERWGKFKPLLKLPPKLMGKLLEVPVIEKTFGVLKESFPYTHLPVEYGFDNMLSALEGTRLRCPSVPEYVDVMIDYYKNHLKPAALKKQRW